MTLTKQKQLKRKRILKKRVKKFIKRRKTTQPPGKKRPERKTRPPRSQPKPIVKRVEPVKEPEKVDRPPERLGPAPVFIPPPPQAPNKSISAEIATIKNNYASELKRLETESTQRGVAIKKLKDESNKLKDLARENEQKQFDTNLNLKRAVGEVEDLTIKVNEFRTKKKSLKKKVEKLDEAFKTQEEKSFKYSRDLKRAEDDLATIAEKKEKLEKKIKIRDDEQAKFIKDVLKDSTDAEREQYLKNIDSFKDRLLEINTRKTQLDLDTKKKSDEIEKLNEDLKLKKKEIYDFENDKIKAKSLSNKLFATFKNMGINPVSGDFQDLVNVLPEAEKKIKEIDSLNTELTRMTGVRDKLQSELTKGEVERVSLLSEVSSGKVIEAKLESLIKETARNLKEEYGQPVKADFESVFSALGLSSVRRMMREQNDTALAAKIKDLEATEKQYQDSLIKQKKLEGDLKLYDVIVADLKDTEKTLKNLTKSAKEVISSSLGKIPSNIFEIQSDFQLLVEQNKKYKNTLVTVSKLEEQVKDEQKKFDEEVQRAKLEKAKMEESGQNLLKTITETVGQPVKDFINAEVKLESFKKRTDEKVKTFNQLKKLKEDADIQLKEAEEDRKKNLKKLEEQETKIIDLNVKLDKSAAHDQQLEKLVKENIKLDARNTLLDKIAKSTVHKANSDYQKHYEELAERGKAITKNIVALSDNGLNTIVQGDQVRNNLQLEDVDRAFRMVADKIPPEKYNYILGSVSNLLGSASRTGNVSFVPEILRRGMAHVVKEERSAAIRPYVDQLRLEEEELGLTDFITDPFLLEDTQLKPLPSLEEQQLLDSLMDNSQREQFTALLGVVGTGVKADMGGALTMSEIDEKMDIFPWFLGTVDVNDLKEVPVDGGGLIILDIEPKEKVGHYVALWTDSADDKSIEYYDPFGRPPTDSVLEYIKRYVDALELDYYLKMKINKIQNQDAKTSNCGWFCMKFLVERASGKPFKECTGYVDLKEHEIEKFKDEFDYI